MNEKQSYTEYNVIVPTQNFIITFEDYNSSNRDVINVTVDGVPATTAGFTVLRISNTVIQLTPAVESGSVVRLQRETDIDNTFYRFTAGAVFTAGNVDKNFQQLLHSQQEVRDGFNKLSADVYPLVNGLEQALQTASDAALAAGAASDAAQTAAEAAEAAAAQSKYILKYYDAAWVGLGNAYPPNARIMLNNGLVVTNISGTSLSNDPNLNMSGWSRKGELIVESIAELTTLQSPSNGMVVKAKSYYDGEFNGGGTFTFINGDTSTVDNVRIFSHPSGRWIRQHWNYASIYDAGIKGDGSDETDILQNLITAAKGKPISLKGKTVKTNGFRIGSNTSIFNGGLDFSSSTIIAEDYRFYDGYIIGDNRPRNYNAEYYVNYATLEQLENINIHHIKFTLPTNPITAFRAVFFHKIDGLNFNYNTLDASNGHTWLQVVGGHDGTNLTGISPDAYVDVLLNGRCNNIKVIGNKMDAVQKTLSGGAYISHKLCHIVSSENITVKHNKTKNVTCAVAVDRYNRDAVVSHNTYKVDAATYALFPDFDSADTFAFYGGQGTYNISFKKNTAKNYGNSGIYAEAVKDCSIKSNTLKVDSSLSVIAGHVQTGIRIQSNVYFMNGANIPEWGSCFGFDVSGNTITSLQAGIATDGSFANSHKDIDISGNNVKSYLNGNSISLANAVTVTLTGNTTNGSLGLGAVSGLNATGNTFSNSSNYALVLHPETKSDIHLYGNTFECFNGSVILNNMNSGNSIKIQGGAIYNRGSSPTLQNTNSGLIEAVDFQSTVASVNVSLAQNLVMTPNSSHKFEHSVLGVKNGWGVQVWMDNMEDFYNNVAVDLNINAVCRDGKIVFIARNIGTGSNTANVFFTARLRTYLNNQYVN